MSKKISQMTPTGVAPATSELALAYDGENYKISPINLVSSSGGGGGIQAVKRYTVGLVGNGTSENTVGLTARDGNLTPGKWIAYKSNYVGVGWSHASQSHSAKDPIVDTTMSQDLLIGLVSSASNLYGMTTVANISEFEPYMSNPKSPTCTFLPYATIDFDGLNPTNGVSNTAPLNPKSLTTTSNFDQDSTIWYDQDGSLSVGGAATCAYRFNVSATGSVSVTNKPNANQRWLGNSVYFFLKYSD